MPSRTAPAPAPSPRSASGGARFLALLRGINVGGKHLLPMKDLAALFVEAGCMDVATFIQSGNVVFTAPPALAEGLGARMAEAILQRHGIQAPVILRGAGDLRRVLRENPFLADGSDVETLHVLFLADAPDPARAAALDPPLGPGEGFALRGREVYLRLPDGVARTKLTNAWFDGRLKTVTTGRNWRTVNKLAELLRMP